MAERLRKRGSAYEAVLRALVALAASKPKAEEVAALLEEPDADPLDLAALDAAWEAEAVTLRTGRRTAARTGCWLVSAPDHVRRQRAGG